MSRFTSSLLGAVAAGILTIGVLAYLQRTRSHEVARLRAENAQLRLEASQRHAANGPTAAAPATEPIKPVASTAPATESRRSPAPESDYRNEGQSSPLATLQTFAWACDRGDSETIKNLLCFEAAGREKAEAFMNTLPSEVRVWWNSPEAMAAEILTHNGMQQPFPAASILERAIPEPRDDGSIVLRLPGTPKDGTVYQKIGDNWHYVITEAAVDDYIASASQPQPGGR